jgi:hypothetical protein|tara:strand:+ start:234 stop:401 length:168 start_codon:yes stop_codon:yes gene_type:complete
MKKDWVVIRFVDTGAIKAWRDYGDHAWGAATYEVLGYYTGSHREAIKHFKLEQET